MRQKLDFINDLPDVGFLGRDLMVVNRACESVLSKNSIEPSRDSMIVAEEPAQPRAALDGTDHTR